MTSPGNLPTWEMPFLVSFLKLDEELKNLELDKLKELKKLKTVKVAQSPLQPGCTTG